VPEPKCKRLYTFFDCQNLFHTVEKVWGYYFPNFDPIKLSLVIQRKYPDWQLKRIYIYTGIHRPTKNRTWHTFWMNKLNVYKKDPRVTVTTRYLKYSKTKDGHEAAREKGIDIKIALDLIRMARLGEYDVAVLFSQDGDFAEVAEELRNVAREKNRWIKIASAYPCNPSMERGIEKTDWIPLSKAEYDSCIDPRNYWPKP
jgi:uncharacterized LabA/DUF88 family protein